MINYTDIESYEEQIHPGRIYRYQIGIEIPLVNIQNLDRMIDYFSGRLRQKLDIQSLRVEKIRILEGEPSEIFIYFSLNHSEAGSVWTTWCVIDQELAPIGKSSLISAYSQAPQLPANLGQSEVGIIPQVNKFLDSWGVLIELILLVIIIAILLGEKKD